MVIKQADKSWRWGPSRATTTTTTTLSRATTNNFTTLGERQHKNKFLIYIKKLLGKRIQEKKQSIKNEIKIKTAKRENLKNATPPFPLSLPPPTSQQTLTATTTFAYLFIYFCSSIICLCSTTTNHPHTHPHGGKTAPPKSMQQLSDFCCLTA